MVPFIECMLNGLSLRETALIIGITHVTAFYWRHKVLSALAKESIGSFEGLVEVDETYFLESHKGRRFIPNRKPRKRGGSATKRGIFNEQVCVLVLLETETKQPFPSELVQEELEWSKLITPLHLILSVIRCLFPMLTILTNLIHLKPIWSMSS